jgi:hypothetical protein
MTLAVRGVVELFRLVRREKELHQEILFFSISHNHYTIRCMHIVIDFGGNVAWRESGALQFFCVQALDIVIEDAVQALYQNAFSNRSRTLCRIVGFIWVVTFLTWSMLRLIRA